MNKIDSIATDIHENNKNLIRMAKDRAFDLIAVGLIVAVGLLSLGAIELRHITFKEVINMVLEAIPFYIASVTLAVNFYKKGAWAGKVTDVFIDIVKTYSRKVNILTGKQLDYINDFCSDFNDKAIKLAQQNVLRAAAIRYDRYSEITFDANGNELRPLCQLSHSELIALIGERSTKIVEKANKVKIKGLNPNSLLGSNVNSDITDLGKTEQELLKAQTKSYALSFAFSTFLLVIMGIKDVAQWGWVGFVLIAFKLIFIICRCYMEYFKGYEDITIKVVNHISRKNDVLKQFDYWYYLRFPKEMDLSDPDYQWLSNISDNSLIYYNNEGSKTGDDGTSPKNVKGVVNER